MGSRMGRENKIIFIVLCAGLLMGCDPKKEAGTIIGVSDTTKPEDNRFIPVVLTPEASLDEPMMFQVTQNGIVYIIERKGGLKKIDPNTNTVSLITTLPVYTGFEQGLIGLALDPDFEDNHWIYLQYSPADESVFELDRYELINDKLVENSRKVVLKFPVDRERTNHTGGGMTWDSKGNLFITVGNNTGNGLLAQTDERPGHSNLDDQRGPANTNDLRGKILRIHPEPDGTYTIPEGNLFPPGTPKTRPEIYTMGHRNVWRVSVDSKTGWIFWGEIGPDQDLDSETGPRGYDEQNMAKGPGFFGWPYFIADNQIIPKYDFAKKQVGEKLDPQKPINTSPNNTGLKELPPAQPALIYYPYAASEKFPLVGSSSRCAIGGPVYHRSDFKSPKRPYPAYYEGKWLIADYSRFWIMAVTLDEDGNYKSMERFAPDYHPVQPLDTKFGPDGDLYVLEYGSNTVRSSVESRLVRVEYNAGNRKPVVMASATKKGGAVPFTTRLTSAGTKDYDHDALTFKWKVAIENQTPQVFATANPEVTMEKPGVYTATLLVTDAKGESNSASVRIVAGNEPPSVTLQYNGNKTFFFDGGAIDYEVAVSDKEDGTLAKKDISPEAVAVSIDYVSGGFDLAPIMLRHADLDASTRYAVAQTLMKNSDCKTCHTLDVKVIGPSFKQIAEKYRGKQGYIDSLVMRIQRGSSGIWGTDNNMPAHPSITVNDARTIVNYILNFNDKHARTIPVKGKYVTKMPKDDAGHGTYIIRAAYTDKGAGTIPALTSDTVIALRSPKIVALSADSIYGGAIRDQLDEYVFLTTRHSSFIAFKKIDMTGIRRILFRANWHLYDIYPGGKVEIRIDGPTGELIGETQIEPEQFNTRYRGLFNGLSNPTREKQERSKRYPPLNPREFFARGSNKNSFTIPSAAILKEISGDHDIYFVFKNEAAKPGESLFPLAEIELRNK